MIFRLTRNLAKVKLRLTINITHSDELYDSVE